MEVAMAETVAKRERPLRVGRVALLVGADQRTVLRMIEAGEFPNAFRLHARGHWRVPREDVNAYLARRPKVAASA